MPTRRAGRQATCRACVRQPPAAKGALPAPPLPRTALSGRSTPRKRLSRHPLRRERAFHSTTTPGSPGAQHPAREARSARQPGRKPTTPVACLPSRRPGEARSHRVTGPAQAHRCQSDGPLTRCDSPEGGRREGRHTHPCQISHLPNRVPSRRPARPARTSCWNDRVLHAQQLSASAEAVSLMGVGRARTPLRRPAAPVRHVAGRRRCRASAGVRTRPGRAVPAARR